MDSAPSKLATAAVWLLTVIPVMALLPVAVTFTFVVAAFGLDSPYTTTAQYVGWLLVPTAAYLAVIGYAGATLHLWHRRRRTWAVSMMLLVEYAGLYAARGFLGG